MSLTKKTKELSRTDRQQSTFFPLFDSFLNRDPFNWGLEKFLSSKINQPSVNIQETAEHYEVQVAAPGLKKEDFDVELNGNLLTISSRKEQSDEANEEGYRRREFSYQSFSRSFELPKDVVDEEKIVAKYSDGILKLTIPKKEEVRKKPAKKIDIA